MACQYHNCAMLGNERCECRLRSMVASETNHDHVSRARVFPVFPIIPRPSAFILSSSRRCTVLITMRSSWSGSQPGKLWRASSRKAMTKTLYESPRQRRDRDRARKIMRRAGLSRSISAIAACQRTSPCTIAAMKNPATGRKRPPARTLKDSITPSLRRG